MSNVYVKFSFRDGGRGKKERLRYFLTEQYRLENPHRSNQVGSISVDDLVDALNEQLREKIQNECGSMRVLAMTHPVDLSNIFTKVKVLEQVSHHQRVRIDDLLRTFESEKNSFNLFDLNHRRTIDKVSGVDYVQKKDKLLILGKPGAGKTTFLKHLASQCSERKLFPECLPLFIVLKNFADAESQPSLLEYIIQGHASWGINDYEIERLLKERRVLLLLDGLDEVKVDDIHRVNRQIESFTNNFHGNRFILTCRIAAQEYVFDKFTEVEVADFNQEQIKAFAQNWFSYKQMPEKGTQFLARLQRNSRIQELATNPLLLTLLCSVFETESDFPASLAELYEEGIFTLLRRWDASRNIERNQTYQELSVARKVGLLSHVALQAFERSEIFFKKQTIATYIADYIVNLPDIRKRKLLPYELERQGEIVLKSIEAQHGLLVERAYDIYSFSHLSFQEYFAAKAIATEYDFDRLKLVFEQIKNKQCHEVFLLAISMSARADGLISLMKQTADEIPTAQPSLIDFLTWVNEKAQQTETKAPPYFVRAFYYTYSFSRNAIASSLDAKPVDSEMDVDRVLIYSLNTLARMLQAPIAPASCLKKLQRIKLDLQAIDIQAIQDAAITPATFNETWLPLLHELDALTAAHTSETWSQDLQQWANHLRVWAIQNRNVGHEWGFNAVELDTLQQYYNANKLLMDCLHHDCYVSRQVQKQIKDTLFSLYGSTSFSDRRDNV
ncbi:MAG: NACHT domain-containing protein [Cyanobacteria bacterium P01_H01_bin.153]